MPVLCLHSVASFLWCGPSVDRACHHVWSAAAGPSRRAKWSLPATSTVTPVGIDGYTGLSKQKDTETPPPAFSPPARFSSNKLRVRPSQLLQVFLFHHSGTFSLLIGTEPASCFMWMELSYFERISISCECCQPEFIFCYE